MRYETKTLDDGIGFVTHTEDGCPILSTFKPMTNTGLNPKIGLSLCSGCGMKCIYCFTNGYQKFRVLTSQEIVAQAHMVFDYCDERELLDYFGAFEIEPGFISTQKEIKISLKQMGDPLLNPGNTIDAMIQLHLEYPRDEYYGKKPCAIFVVSTAAPKLRTNKRFFENIKDFHADIRLQFSCHTTSDEERSAFCKGMPIMSLKEIANVANKSVRPVTLNFVMFSGCEYDANKIHDLFDRDNVFIKINYIDENSFTRALKLRDMHMDKVKRFTSRLSKLGFNWEFRYEHTEGKRLEIIE